MQLCDIFLGLGEDTFSHLLRSISLGKLKTYQLFDRLKTRLYLNKLNSETLRKSAPRSWARLQEKDDEFATELSQAILISHMDMIVAVLNHLGVPHQDGFFDKDADVAKHLKEGWRAEAWEKFKDSYPPSALLFYINHLAFEVAKTEDVFVAPAV
jgi:hypothetical protein